MKLVQIPPGEETDVTKLMTAVRGGTGPDIYFLDRFTVAQRAADGVLQDLSAMGGGDVISNYIPFAQAEAMYNGVVYALPFDTDARALYYNKGMLVRLVSMRPRSIRPMVPQRGTRSLRSPTSSMSWIATRTTRRWASSHS